MDCVSASFLALLVAALLCNNRNRDDIMFKPLAMPQKCRQADVHIRSISKLNIICQVFEWKYSLKYKTVEKYEFLLKTAFIILISESFAANHGLFKLLKQTLLYGTMYVASEFLRRKTG